MGSDWQETTIGGIATLQRGFDISKKEQTEGAIPVISSGGIGSYHNESKHNGPGVLLGRKGTLGSVYWTDVPHWPHSTILWVKDFHGNDPKFIYYFFKAMGPELLRMDVGAANPTLNRNHVHPLPALRPPLPEQKAIAHILGSLDDKIELNRKMNATLEAMAQALFKSWFVDFDPVIDNVLRKNLAKHPSPSLSQGERDLAGPSPSGRSGDEGALQDTIYNGIPEELLARAEIRRQAIANGAADEATAEHFPSAFQETEELGWIPEGWEVSSFEKLAKLDTTSVKPFEHPETIWEHYSIPSYDSTSMPSLDLGNKIKSNKYQVKAGAILSSKLNPETERTWWPLMMNPSAAICSTEFMQFVPKNKAEQAFVYSQIRSEPFQKSILERVTGSTGSRQRAQPKQIAEIDVIDCGESLRVEYVRQALPLIQASQNNLLQSNTLTKLRDTLLPKLISGELRVSEAQRLLLDQ